MTPKRKVISQMFDVRPVNQSGDLDLEKISKIKKILELRKKDAAIEKKTEVFREIYQQEKPPVIPIKKVSVYQLGRKFDSESVPVWSESSFQFSPKKIPEPVITEDEEKYENYALNEPQEPLGVRLRTLFFGKSTLVFSVSSLVIILIISSFVFLGKGIKVKEEALASSESAYQNLSQAKNLLQEKDFQGGVIEFKEAEKKFENISASLDSLGGILLDSGKFLPFLSKATSGKYLSASGENISKIGVLISQTLESFDQIKNPLEKEGEDVSFLEIFKKSDQNLKEIDSLLLELEENLGKVNLDDIPEDKRGQFVEIRDQLPEIKGFTEGFIKDSQIFVDFLGGNGPRKYLFLFQNNNEMRATGGFIGSYGILDIFNGRVRNFFVDGIFNPDGQLREKVIPPAPIQKISAAWSLHDSNWFPDFPTSAEKARWFYEKTGGPTVDGVISMTPTVLRKLIAITGPIDMPEYGFVVDENNFMEKIQEEVEVNYDKELNQPKKVLSDLAPKILDKLFTEKDFDKISKTLGVLAESLNEKHILIYANNLNIENKISEKGWSGEILKTQKDFLSVINSNINGFKTDGVIEENISHRAEIKEDGSVIDEVEITRHHNGGDSNYEWFNKVNADYMRVYVPKGSKLISAEGQTREFNSPPIDYGLLGFKRDPQVEREEQSMEIDEESGTRIYDDFEKTVFANWVYVSPKETVVVKYKYLLPFRISIDSKDKLVDNYSLLVQKQSGSLGSGFDFQLKLPEKMKTIWRYPDDFRTSSEQLFETKTDLKKDKFFGVAITSKDAKL